MSDRWMLVAAAHARASWVRELARWSSAATVQIELVVCSSTEEVDVLLESSQLISAVLFDASLPGLGRDLVCTVGESGATSLVVGSSSGGLDWADLGAVQTLPDDFSADALLSVLRQFARPIEELRSSSTPPADPRPATGGGQVVSVIGSGGTGTSTVARAVAAGLGANRPTLLVDAALNADQAIAHDVGDVVPGLPELLAHCRHHTPAVDDTSLFTLAAPAEPHHLLLGLRRHADWPTVRRTTLDVALGWCRRAFDLTVIDCDDDVEGEAETGSFDIEERNRLARTVVRAADVVLITGRPDTCGIHRLNRLIGSLRRLGIEDARLATVLVGVSRRPVERLALGHAVAALAEGTLRKPFLVRHVGGMERLVRDGRALPATLVRPLADDVARLLGAMAPAETSAHEPEPVIAGSLGHWYDAELR